jgi:hypothetical protein
MMGITDGDNSDFADAGVTRQQFARKGINCQ